MDLVSKILFLGRPSVKHKNQCEINHKKLRKTFEFSSLFDLGTMPVNSQKNLKKEVQTFSMFLSRCKNFMLSSKGLSKTLKAMNCYEGRPTRQHHAPLYLICFSSHLRLRGIRKGILSGGLHTYIAIFLTAVLICQCHWQTSWRNVIKSPIFWHQ